MTVELWRDPETDGERSCCSASAVRTARGLAHRMGLPHLTLDVRDAFRAGVVDPWMADHAAGLTPNPCVRCNGGVRLDAMLDLADRLGAGTLATGHYARTDPASGLLRLAADPAKDQAYALAAVSPRALARLRFPLGELTKPDVRALAAEHALPVAATPDSQDLCFLAGTGRSAFLARHGDLGERAGDVVDQAGRGRRPPPRRAPLHRRPAPRAGADRGDGRAAVRPAHRRRREHRDGRAAGRAGHRHRARARRPPAPPAAPRSTPSSCATAPRRWPARSWATRSACASPCSAPPRARPRSSWAGTACWGVPRSGRDVRRDPRAVPVLLRGAWAPAPAVLPAGPGRRGPVGALHDRGHEPAQALLPGARAAAAPAADRLPEVLPHRRHRGRRHDRAPPDVLRDARELLDRRLLQGGRRRGRARAVAGGLRLRPGRHLGHGLRGRRGARARPGRGGRGDLGARRHPARAHRALPALGELVAVRSDRPVRAVLGALPRPRRGVRPRPTTVPARRTSASWSTGTSSSCSSTRIRSGR